MMHCRFLRAAAVAALLFFPGLAAAEDLSAVSDRDLTLKTREAVVAQDASAALELLTEMQRRGTGLFAGTETAECKERIELPEGITDWRFKGTARQAYITAAKSLQLDAGSCGCLFAEYPFDAFTIDQLGKQPAGLVDADRTSLEAYLRDHQRDVEGRYRAFEASCRAN
jgi:hypothetical protein